MEELKRITPGEAKNYVGLDIYDPNVCKLATHFTLTPSSIPNPDGSGFEDVTYYTTQEQLDRHPLEIMLDEWNTHTIKDNGNFPGENPFSHD